MRRQILIAVLVALLVSPTFAAPQRLWTLPKDATLVSFRERPNHRLGIYWSPDPALSDFYTRFSMLDANGKFLQGGQVAGKHFGSGVDSEDWNARGQHAYLPQCDSSDTNFCA